ncbi:hypothetical protein JZK55_00610 [Dissulfurispira thermophila]|uniref:Lipoprotein n=2 Tax=root TaxID=1 RepID=A0A7G1GYS6_9BACT|nr:hypothetical protein [Dissulfurispira thermophila]BCB95139.1 hypothetical protein JZK55_00610 [Dissulfurispira thermophila]
MKEMNNKCRLLIFLAMLLNIALVAGCSDTFVVTKDGKSYFFGSNREGFYKMICESGDLDKILADTKLPQNIKDDLYKYNCTASQSRDKVKEIYSSMTPEQRRDLRLAFQLHGYDINLMAC